MILCSQIDFFQALISLKSQICGFQLICSWSIVTSRLICLQVCLPTWSHCSVWSVNTATRFECPGLLNVWNYGLESFLFLLRTSYSWFTEKEWKSTLPPPPPPWLLFPYSRGMGIGKWGVGLLPCWILVLWWLINYCCHGNPISGLGLTGLCPFAVGQQSGRLLIFSIFPYHHASLNLWVSF